MTGAKSQVYRHHKVDTVPNTHMCLLQWINLDEHGVWFWHSWVSKTTTTKKLTYAITSENWKIVREFLVKKWTVSPTGTALVSESSQQINSLTEKKNIWNVWKEKHFPIFYRITWMATSENAAMEPWWCFKTVPLVYPIIQQSNEFNFFFSWNNWENALWYFWTIIP